MYVHGLTFHWLSSSIKKTRIKKKGWQFQKMARTSGNYGIGNITHLNLIVDVIRNCLKLNLDSVLWFQMYTDIHILLMRYCGQNQVKIFICIPLGWILRNSDHVSIRLRCVQPKSENFMPFLWIAGNFQPGKTFWMADQHPLCGPFSLFLRAWAICK